MSSTQWPSLAEGYQDEFGPVDADVYEAAGRVLPAITAIAENLLGDAAAAPTLLLKAAAAVTKRRRARDAEIDDLPRYVFVAAKRLLMAQRELQDGRRKILDEHQVVAPWMHQVAQLDAQIAVKQLEGHMDAWTLRVFQWLTLGHSFNEIAAELHQNPQVVRTRFRRAMARLRREVLT